MSQTVESSFMASVEIAASFAHLANLVNAAVPEPDTELFQTMAWFDHLAAHGFVGGVQTFLPCLRDACADTLLALPMAQSGGGLRSLSNYYSSLYGPAGQGWPAAGHWLALAATLRRHAAGAVLDWQPLDADGAFIQALAPALRAAGYWTDSYDCFGNWYLPVVHARFADYFSALPSPLRNSIERGRRRLQRTEGYHLHIQADAGAGLEEAIAAFEGVYRRSWKKPEPCPEFMPGLMRMAAQRGWLRLGVLQLQGQPVAAQVWLVVGGKANIYKLAYVQGFERLSPGSVLTAALMAHAMDVDRVREVDYLTGDDAYKRDWMTHRRVRVGLLAFDPLRWRGLVAAARHFGGRRLRAVQAFIARMRR